MTKFKEKVKEIRTFEKLIIIVPSRISIKLVTVIIFPLKSVIQRKTLVVMINKHVSLTMKLLI